jgi:hypothetical protein
LIYVVYNIPLGAFRKSLVNSGVLDYLQKLAGRTEKDIQLALLDCLGNFGLEGMSLSFYFDNDILDETREEVSKRTPLMDSMKSSAEDKEIKLAKEWALSKYEKNDESAKPKLFFGTQFLKFSRDEMVVRNDTTSDQSFQVIFTEFSRLIL